MEKGGKKAGLVDWGNVIKTTGVKGGVSARIG